MSTRTASPRTLRTRTALPDKAVTPRPAVAPETVADDTVKRLSFPLRADGTIDAESLRTSTKQSLRTALLDPNLSAALGVSSVAPQDTKMLAQLTGGLFDGLSLIAVALAQRVGYDASQAAIVALTPDDKDVLAEPTAKVIDKYFPDLGGKYRDEIMLCLALTNVVAAKVLLLRSGARILPDGSIVIGGGSTVAPVLAPQASEPTSVS